MPKRRLKFVDGLRGVAAVIVAGGHILGMVGPDRPVIPIWKADTIGLVLWPWTFGGPVVWLFIMLSGFTLYWTEESRRLGGRGATPFRVYWQRRFWHILPTYYAALTLGAVVVLVLGWLLVALSQAFRRTSQSPLTGCCRTCSWSIT